MATPSTISVLQKIEIASIVSNFVFSLILVIVGVLGYLYYLAVSRSNKIERAIELAKFYKDNVLDKFNKIEQSFVDLGLNTYIKKFNKKRHYNFDRADLAILTSEEIDKYIDAPLQEDVSNLISEILNCLEYFALNFTNGIADANSIYQTLHQNYIETVETLSINICISNCDKDEFKYYTNVIQLYDDWKDISVYRQELIDEAKEDAIGKVIIASKKAKENINKILNNR